jgi:hypothetical protein
MDDKEGFAELGSENKRKIKANYAAVGMKM